ncbi:hypothetical protein HU200_056613 [Digitaria exilis]|uniref:Uncharacterized protein n=1 Tax=Digitaria exilis TaxID=1010633 RepID=A0A835AKT7_9POAL|nr:hypothetical protein HU200_056613 [Digitaria exilis]
MKFTCSWQDIKLVPEYRAVMAVALTDGETTSFWHDTWSEAGVLRNVLPAPYSHCLDTDITVAEVVATGGLAPKDLQPRLSSVASADLVLLTSATGIAEAIGGRFPASDFASHIASVTVLWVIWKAQNAMIFNSVQQDAATIS